MSGKDVGMDGLDALMASLNSSKLAPPSSKGQAEGPGRREPAKRPESDAHHVVAEPNRDVPERVVYFLSRLKDFQIRAADPTTREELNKSLSRKSQDFEFFMHYYYERPELSQYTVQAEIGRMAYTVYPDDGGAAVTSRADIMSLYERHKASERDDLMMLWRISNQSVLSDTLQELSASFAKPEDVELCIAISNTSSKFDIDFVKRKMRAESVFAISTVGVGKDAMTRMGSLGAVVEVDLVKQKLVLGVKEFKLAMVFDDVLEAAARALAKGEDWRQPGNGAGTGQQKAGPEKSVLQGIFSMGSSLIGSVVAGGTAGSTSATKQLPQLYKK